MPLSGIEISYFTLIRTLRNPMSSAVSTTSRNCSMRPLDQLFLYYRSSSHYRRYLRVVSNRCRILYFCRFLTQEHTVFETSSIESIDLLNGIHPRLNLSQGSIYYMAPSRPQSRISLTHTNIFKLIIHEFVRHSNIEMLRGRACRSTYHSRPYSHIAHKRRMTMLL